jgi:hypothetical protein
MTSVPESTGVSPTSVHGERLAKAFACAADRSRVETAQGRSALSTERLA